MLDRDPELRKACKADRKKAWETLKQAGDFEDMPNDVEIHVFENEVGSSDKMVTMILPKEGELPPADIFDAKGVWVCTWAHYLQ